MYIYIFEKKCLYIYMYVTSFASLYVCMWENRIHKKSIHVSF